MKCWEQLYYSLLPPPLPLDVLPRPLLPRATGAADNGRLEPCRRPLLDLVLPCTAADIVLSSLSLEWYTARPVTSVGEENPAGVPCWPLWTAVSLVTLSDSLSLSLTSQPCAAASCSVQSACSSPDSLSPSLPVASLSFLKTSPVVKVDRWDWLSAMTSM